MGRKSVSEMEKRQQIMEKAGKMQYRKALCILGFFLLPVIGICTFPALAAQPGASHAAVIAGVTSGMSVADIMKDAVSSGMTAGQAVTAMVNAGADPGIVVYEAIHAGYGAEPVVKGAAAAGRQLYCGNALLAPCTSRVCGIVSAAMQNGASEKQVQRWIADAGVPAVAIANAGAQSCLDAAPVEGYSSPNNAAPSPVVGSQNNGYNGGVSGIPLYAASTEKASKHEPGDNNGNHYGWEKGKGNNK